MCTVRSFYSGQAAPHRTGKPPRWTCPGPGEMPSSTGTLDGFRVRNLRLVGDQIYGIKELVSFKARSFSLS